MIRVTPSDPYIYLSKDECPLLGKAFLTAKVSCGRQVGALLSVSVSADGIAVGPVPYRLPNGTYRLAVLGGHDQVYETLVHLDMQPEIAMQSHHTPTNPNAGDTIIECVPDNEGENDVDQTAGTRMDS